MPVLILRFLIVALLAYAAGATVPSLIYAQAVTTQAKETLSPFMICSAGILLFGVGYVVKQIFHR
jgi:hypothetical protein